jgi:membrane protein DedA with SNARE-associated domain
MEEQFLSALLVYGYPILGVTLLLGAVGLPLPTGLSAAVAGSLSALGRMDWLTAGTIAVPGIHRRRYRRVRGRARRQPAIS